MKSYLNKKTLLAAGALVAGGTYWQVARKWRLVRGLKWFLPDEWRGQWPLLSAELLRNLDQFRDNIGAPVIISPAPGALFRVKSKNEQGNSQHFYGRAADIMLPGGLAPGVIDAAKAAGFTGIGAYPHWAPYPGLHLDVRPGALATWAGIDPFGGGQYYVSLSEGLRYV